MVKAWKEKVVIPTYEVGQPEKNPIFLEKRVYQGSSGVVYPYPVIESISNEKTDHEWHAVFIENEYIKVMVLPELGGRIQMAYDKIRQRHFVYYNHVIKPALVGLAGPWISGGIEFNWPQHHRPSTYMPVDCTIEENVDGSVTVWVSEMERMFHQKGMAGFTLRPGCAYLEIKGVLYNRTDVPQTFLWWANPAVAVNDHYRSVFPPDINIGLDAGFFNNRLQLNIDAYQRTRSDVILTKQLMSYHELTEIDYNSKENYRSRGVDIGIHSVNITNRDFTWSTDLNISFYRNKTISRDPDFIPAAYQPMEQDWGDIYGWQTNGLVQQGQNLAHLPSSGAGAINYLDVNGYQLDENGERMRNSDGRYLLSGTPDGLLDEADYVVLYNSTPIPFSINNTFTWKNWDANIYIYGSLRGRKINDVKLQSVYGIEDITYGVNALTDVMNRWRPSNPNGDMPGVAEAKSGFDPSDSDFFYENAWYLRIDNISVGYTFPTRWFKDKIKTLRVYGAVRNIGVITPYKGMDPETGNGIGAYPNNFQVAVGLDLKF